MGIKMPKISWIGERCPLIPHYKKNAIWSPGFAMLVKDKDGKTTVKSREIKNKFDMKNETLNPTNGYIRSTLTTNFKFSTNLNRVFRIYLVSNS